jgi:uncharacterized protein
MTEHETEQVITRTKNWVSNVVVGCNFCPFAAKEVKKGSIHYIVLENATLKTTLEAAMLAMIQLDNDDTIETSLLILPGSFLLFDDYLQMLGLAESLLEKEDYEGIYQMASFHPQYLFAGSTNEDPSNYTNRSPYPMLHFLRESSITKAVDSYPGIDDVPQRNIAFTKEKGLLYMQQLMQS